jgi:hypothetical protein|tara:strand:- start:2067 stop:2810 length:744 start_codon:yes stop_codon:yes gene_type:complete
MSERDERLQNAIDRIKNLDDSMKVNLKGKKYTMVAQRVQAFREAFGCGANISTEIVVCDDTKVIVKATVSVQRDGAWVPIATEFAEEYRGVGMVNKSSALENCCTSSIGRALAACGLSGGEYASSFEVDNAINNKAEAPETPKQVASPISKVEAPQEKPVEQKPQEESKEISIGQTPEDAKAALELLKAVLKMHSKTREEAREFMTLPAQIQFKNDLKEHYKDTLFKELLATMAELNKKFEKEAQNG